MNYKLVVVISMIFITQSLRAQQPFEKSFKDCVEASHAAEEDVQKDSIRFFTLKSGYADPSDPLDKTIDSLLLADYHITTIRNADFAWDFTQNCYNNRILKHLDSSYSSPIILETLKKAELLLKD